MQNAILVPGRPDKDQHYDPNRRSNSEDFFFSWLKRQLILKDILAVTIEPPMPFRPRYDEWKKEFERFDLKPDTILIGHSCGGGFLLRYLSEHPSVHIGKVVLVAPWTNPLYYEESDTADFFDFEIDPDFPSRTEGVTVFISSDDDPSVVKTVELIEDKVTGLDVNRFNDRGHFTSSDQFPELLDVLALS